ncbi:MAG: DUF4258 domain-containing protein [Nitrososphaerota archaeon]
MKIIYTVHALKRIRIRERNLSKDIIKECIENPLKLISENNIKRVIRKMNNKLFVVIYKIENEKFIVITAYIISKIEKYLK